MKKVLPFVAALGIGGLAIWRATLATDHARAIISGIVAIVVHSAISWRQANDEESADASYFLGFLLTLVLLAAGLWKLAPNDGGVGGAQSSQMLNVLPFVRDLGAGFLLTIVGLTARQVRVLAMGETGAANDERLRGEMLTLLALQKDLVVSTRHLTNELNGTNLTQTIHQADEALAKTRESLQDIGHVVKTVTKELEKTVRSFTTAVRDRAHEIDVTTASATMMITQGQERIAGTVVDALETIGSKRDEIRSSLELSAKLSGETQAMIGAALEQQRGDWQAELDRAHHTLETLHIQLNERYQESLASMQSAAATFADLTARVQQYIYTMPVPSERLSELWAGIQQLDDLIANNARNAAGQLSALGAQANAAAESVELLAQSTQGIADDISDNAKKGAKIFAGELNEIEKTLEQFHSVLGERVGKAAR